MKRSFSVLVTMIGSWVYWLYSIVEVRRPYLRTLGLLRSSSLRCGEPLGHLQARRPTATLGDTIPVETAAITVPEFYRCVGLTVATEFAATPQLLLDEMRQILLARTNFFFRLLDLPRPDDERSDAHYGE